MLISKENFYDVLDSEVFAVNSEKLDSIELATLKRVYGNQVAGTPKGIVYTFRSEKKVPRLKGESDVLYIGQTTHTFKQRYLGKVQIFSRSSANRLKFEHILSHYGAIRISLAPFEVFGISPAKAEEQLLWWYFQNHCEYPPLNYTRTKCRNDVLAPPVLVTPRLKELKL